MTLYSVGVDIGTGSTKAVAINAKGEVLFSFQSSYPTVQSKPGYSEQDPELIWQAFTICIQKITAHVECAPAAITLSSAMHSLIAVDANGNALIPMITWADNRSAVIAEAIKNSPEGEALYRQTGTPIHAMSPLCKIVWLCKNETELVYKTHKFISIKEFIWFRLFNVFEIDHSLASATGLFDIQNRVWCKEALVVAGIDSIKLSDAVSTGFARKIFTHELITKLGVTDNTSFVIGASDGCMANLGSFATVSGDAALTIGTSGAVRVGNSKPTFNFKAMTFNYILDEETYISGGPINNGGVAFKWYVESFIQRPLKTAEDYASILNPVKSIEAGSNGLLFLPYLLGDRAPIWNSEACGVFFGITIRHTQVHFTRAVLEGISLSLYHVASALEESGLTINQINVSGGFVHSPIWVQLLADVFNKKICLVNPEDASALGAAYMGLKSLKIISDYKELKPKETEEYHPDLNNHSLYKKSFLRYKNLYNKLESEMVKPELYQANS